MTRLILYPADHQVEQEINTWHIPRGLTDGLQQLEPAERLLRELAAAWSRPGRFMLRQRTRQAMFYCWYNSQAGYLGVSLSSRLDLQELFGPVVQLESPRPLLEQLLGTSKLRIDVQLSALPVWTVINRW